jgi:hypothetical protein
LYSIIYGEKAMKMVATMDGKNEPVIFETIKKKIITARVPSQTLNHLSYTIGSNGHAVVPFALQTKLYYFC